ncbi:hypothetical protein, partial [Bacillus mycoides]|uniref:hypothetical protein n=1 Tax=Bacillus mycoides TaxID=1405 RepID=UPI0019D5AB04
ETLISGGFLHPPLIISPHQSGFYGQPDPNLTSLLSLHFEVGSYCPANSGINNKKRVPELWNTFFYIENKFVF